MDSALTVAFWWKGSPEQPLADHIMEAGQRGGRLVNIHLPWSTGTVYWDAGGRLSGNTNRIAKQSAPGEFKGRWNHWAFTKDARSGRMAIYLNGELWHEAGNMSKGMAGIDRVVVGANGNANGGWYAGSLDALRFYEAALTEEEVARVMEGDAHPGRGTSRDSIPAAQLSVLLFEDPSRPRSPTDTLNLWPAYDEILDADGRLLEQVEIAEPAVLTQSRHEWYGEPFEVTRSMEIGRFITPYGKRLDLGEDGFTWTVDVIGYAPLLRGEVELEAHNGYELLDLRFEFLPGEPPRVSPSAAASAATATPAPRTAASGTRRSTACC